LKIEEEIHQIFIEKKLTLSLAESCTGGACAARLTALPGSSEYFFGSIVAYHNSLKKKVLSVSEQTLKEKGAVSPETAREMVMGLLHLTQSDYGVAVTGIAGPSGGTLEKPVGTIWGAICRKGDEPFVWKMMVEGPRKKIIEVSVDDLLNQLLKYVKANES
jgi:PncC family amidohydrolase